MADWNTTSLPDLLARVTANRRMWHEETKLKYLSIRIDTRDGNFLLFDRDGKPVEVAEVVAACLAAETRSSKTASQGQEP